MIPNENSKPREEIKTSEMEFKLLNTNVFVFT